MSESISSSSASSFNVVNLTTAEEDDQSQQQERLPSNLNLRQNDNTFHVLASLLVDFFQSKLVVNSKENIKTIVLEPTDKESLQRMLPKTAVWDFIDSVNYRLEMTPVVPVLPIHLLTMQCQELCFDKERSIENPILAMYKIKDDTIIVNVLPAVTPKNNNDNSLVYLNHGDETDSKSTSTNENPINKSDDRYGDNDDEAAVADADGVNGYVHTVHTNDGVTSDASDLSSSSDVSGIKVASSKDIADEMLILSDTDKKSARDAVNVTMNPIIAVKNNSLEVATSEDNAHTISHSGDVPGSSSSSVTSGIKVASSNDIAAEMLLLSARKGEISINPEVVHMATNPIVSIKNINVNNGTEIDQNDVDNEVRNYSASKRNSNVSEVDVIECTSDTNDGLVPDCTSDKEADMNKNTVVSFNAVGIDDEGEEDVGEEIDLLPTVTETFDVEIDSIVANNNCTDGTNNEKESNHTFDFEKDNNVTTDDNLSDMDNIDDATEKETNYSEALSNHDETNCIAEKNDADIKTGVHCDMDHTPDDCNLFVSDSGIDMYDHETTGSRGGHIRSKNVNIEQRTTKEKLSNIKITVSPATNHSNQWFDDTKSAISEAANSLYGGLEKAIVDAIVATPVNDQSRSRNESSNLEMSATSNDEETETDIHESGNFLYNEFEKAIINAIVANPVEYATPSSSKRSKPENPATKTESRKPDNNIDVIPKEDARAAIPVSPASFSIQSGFNSLFAGLAGGFARSVNDADSRCSHGKNNIATYPSDECASKNGTLDALDTIDCSAYESMEVSDTAAKQQLILELKEACTLMRQSITPETTRFWRDHIQILKRRLEALRNVGNGEQIAVVAANFSEPSNDRGGRGNNFESNDGAVDLSDVHSTAAMSDIRSTKGIPVVQANSHYSNNCINEYENQESVNEQIEHQTYSPPFEEPEIELSNSRNRINVNPSDEIYSQQNDSHQQQSIPIDDGYYEYPLVDVVAPADLPGGYHFEAEIEGQRFLATVPPGGVQQGETFTCYMKELDSVAIDIPVGAWKDGLCNMCELGWCHPVLWNAIFCPLIALGQIQTRIHLDFLGRPKFGDLQYSNRYMMLMVITFWIITNCALFAACNLKWSHGLELSVADGCAFALVNVAMFGFTVFVTQSTRSSVREKFMIRERCCYDLEDVCCAALCLPCTVGQMQRHTANYDDYEGVCCSKTGLPNGVRVNQEPAKVKESTVENEDGYMV